MATNKKTTDAARDKHEPARPVLRPFWSGTVSFGLVSVPVDLYPSARSRRISLRMLSPEGNPLVRKYYCPKDDRILSRDELVRGYQVSNDHYVVIQDDELEALAPRKSRDIDLSRFVPRTQISPGYFDRAYYLTPSGDSNKAYRLLAEVMENNDRAGIATFVMRGKEHLVAILSDGGILRAQTLRFADELRQVEEVGIPEAGEVAQNDIEAVAVLCRKHTRDTLPEDALEDVQSRRLAEIIDEKLRAGRDIVDSDIVAEEEEDEETEEDDELAEDRADLLETIRHRLRAGSAGDQQEKTAKIEQQITYADGLAQLTKRELYDRAQEQDVKGRSKMSKEELLHALRQT